MVFQARMASISTISMRPYGARDRAEAGLSWCSTSMIGL